MSKEFGKEICAVFDVVYDLACGPHNLDTVDEKMRLTKEAGFKKIYLVAQQDNASAWQKDHPTVLPDGVPHYEFESFLNLGDPWFQYIRMAKKHGLEVIIRFKPYESGGAFSMPSDRRPYFPYNTLEQLGGKGYGYPDFIHRHPEMRVRRLNYRKEDRPVTSVEFVFFGESVRIRSGDQGRMITCPLPETLHEPFTGMELYYSVTNGKYTRLDVPCREFTEKRLIQKMDGSGNLLFNEPKLCRILQYENLRLPENAGYLAFRCASPEKFFTLPYTMMKLYSKGEEIDSTTCLIPRHKPFLMDNLEYIGDGPLDFRKNGFEFESIESVFRGDGMASPLEGIGLARGKMEYMKGILCEGYPEVRQYWLRRIREFIDMGVDGISIRFRCHSGSVLDFASYGGNEVLLEQYRKRYGSTDRIDGEKMMRVRGEFFLEFYEAASKMLHAAGKTIECDAQADFCNPHMDHDYNHVGFWTMPKIIPDYRKLTDLSDRMSLDDFNFGVYDPGCGAPLKEYAAASGKPFQVHCYLQQGNDLNPEFLAAVDADPRITGIEIYEMVCNRIGGYQGYGKQELRGYFSVAADGSVEVNRATVDALEALTGLRRKRSAY